jgi:hypothetical protein
MQKIRSQKGALHEKGICKRILLKHGMKIANILNS